MSRIQLAAAGYDSDAARWRVAAARWQRVGHAYVLENGEVTYTQRAWAAVLSAPGLVALTGRSAAESYGLRGFPPDAIDVLVPRGTTRLRPIDGVRWRESRRFTADDVAPRPGIPTVRRERAVVDAAAWTPKPRVACALLAAAVQQRVVLPAALRRELIVGRGLPHLKLLRSILGDIEGGADSLAEIDFVVLARKAGLPPPIRQCFRVDAAGRRRYLDVDFGTFCVEVDGGIHLRPLNYWDDANENLSDAGVAKLDAAFRAKYPNVTLNRTAKTFNDILSTEKLQASGANPPDILISNGGYALLGPLATASHDFH